MPRGRVLVVDDSHDTRVALRELLEDEGYVVSTACTGLEALQLLRSGKRPHVAIVDLWMPMMDGIELAQHIRSDPTLSDLPLILMTATRPVDDILAIADEFCPKPLSREKLLGVVERYAAPTAG
jgi:CheY-like chemotaxis protein